MHESIRLAVIALDEAEALHCVEELDRPAGFLTGQLSLRAAAIAAAGGSAAPATALDRHRFAFDSQVRGRDPAAAIDEREFERLAIGQVGQTGLLDRGDMDEHVLAAVIANDEAEALLRVEELYDAFAFADDLGRHSATATAAAAAEATTAGTAAAAKATASTAAAVAAGALAKASAAAECASSTAAAVAAAFLESATIAGICFFEKPVALVFAATTTVALAPSIKTHCRLNFRVPQPDEKPTRWAPRRNRSRAILTHARFMALHEKSRPL
jgi:hypothetical protein